MKQRLEDTLTSLKNPFIDFYLWVKGEIYDIGAMEDAILGRDKMSENRNNLSKKVKGDIAVLEKLNTGKKTLKTFFKSQGGRQTEITNLNNSIAQS
jgi:hypothetical protein